MGNEEVHSEIPTKAKTAKFIQRERFVNESWKTHKERKAREPQSFLLFYPVVLVNPGVSLGTVSL